MIRLLTAHLLRRHVTDRPHHCARIGDLLLCRSLTVRDANLMRLQFRQAEVENLDAPVLGDEEILRLEVTMDDSFLVSGSESAGDLLGVLYRAARRQRAFVQLFAQFFAFEQFGHDEGRASCSKRLSRSASCANEAGRTLMATLRPSRVSSAR